MWTLVPVLLVVAVSYAAMTTLNGEVTKYEIGKTISVKDFTGNVLALEITKDTKVEGDVKVGSRVVVEADGRKVKSLKAMASGPGSDGFGGG
jgi:hypothetical protein